MSVIQPEQSALLITTLVLTWDPLVNWDPIVIWDACSTFPSEYIEVCKNIFLNLDSCIWFAKKLSPKPHSCIGHLSTQTEASSTFHFQNRSKNPRNLVRIAKTAYSCLIKITLSYCSNPVFDGWSNKFQLCTFSKNLPPKTLKIWQTLFLPKTISRQQNFTNHDFNFSTDSFTSNLSQKWNDASEYFAHTFAV